MANLLVFVLCTLLLMILVALLTLHSTCKEILAAIRQLQVPRPNYTEDLDLIRNQLGKIKTAISDVRRRSSPEI